MRTVKLDYLDKMHLLIQKLVIDNEKGVPVKELALAVGKSESSVYKAADPNSVSNLPFEWLPVFENIAEDYSLLQLHCRLTGHLPAVVEPRYSLDVDDEKKLAKKFTKELHGVIDEFEEFLDAPSREGLKSYKKTAEEAIKQLLSSIYYAEKAVKGNGELGL